MNATAETFETASPVIAGRNGALPHSTEAEDAVLASILIDPDTTLDRCHTSRLTARSFYEPKNAIVFERILAMRGESKPVDIATVAVELRTAGELDRVGGYSYLVQITTATPTTAEAAFFIQKVRDQHTLREIIHAAHAAIEDCRNFKGDLPELTAGLKRRLDFATTQSSKEPQLAARALTMFEVPPPNDPSNLLGNRFLCRGDGAVLSSSSGMGKSSITLQAAVTWSLNRPFLGIQPNGALKSIILQAEDSDGDIAEVWTSILFKLQLTPQEIALVSERVLIITNRIHRGPTFLAELQKQVAAHKPDLVWINPLAAFMSGDATTQEVAGDFLRAGLNGINAKSLFAYLIVQHTTKPATGKDRSDRRWHEVMYDMAGSYDIIGWARAILSLRPTETIGEFNLVLAKRGRRAGVTKKIPQGVGYRLEATTIIPVKHCTETMPVPGLQRELPVIFWEPREEAASSEPNSSGMGRPKKHDITPYLGIFPTDKSKALGFREMHRICSQIKPISSGSLFSLVQAAIDSGKLSRDSSNPVIPRYFLTSPKEPSSIYVD